MRAFILITLPILFLSGCATVESRHKNWTHLVAEYHNDCDNWVIEVKSTLTRRFDGEEKLRRSEVENLRCLEDYMTCMPPRKIEGLAYYEYFFNEIETADCCQDFESSRGLAKIYLRNKDNSIFKGKR